MELPLLKNAKDLNGKRVLLRLDLNIPVIGGKIQDDYRIEKILPTLQFLKEEQAAKIIILSHHSDKKQSLKPIARFFGKTVPNRFVSDIFDEDAFVSGGGEETTVFVCENLRFWDGEESNDNEFAQHLASLGDIYVNDAFSASHREHASIVTLPRLLGASYVGFLFTRETEELSRAFHPEHPFLFVLGGAKPKTKIPLIMEFLNRADTVFLGGIIASSFFRKLGYEIGRSLAEEMSDISKILDSPKILLPHDVVVKNDEGVFVRLLEEVSPGDMILDVGPATMEKVAALVKESRFVLWNGPLGDYTKPGFEKASVVLAKAIKESSAQSIVGGGDTVALLRRERVEYSSGFVSSGGGAMLQFLAEGTLPGIEALKNSM